MTLSPNDNSKIDFASILAAFFSGDSSWYNFWVFGFAVVGLMGALVALWVAIHQIRKTRQAAEAARDAAKDAKAEVAKITAVVDLSRLSQLASETIVHLRAENLRGATIRALDLRVGIAQVRQSRHGKRLLSKPKWQQMITDVSTIQEMLEEEGQGRWANEFPLQNCLKTISSVYQQLSELATSAVAVSTGEK